MTPEIPPPQPDEQTAIRRATQKLKLPMVSGRGSALVLLLLFCVSSGLLVTAATSLRFPLWIDFELVLLAWWLVWIAALGHFLYHGKRVSDDHVMQPPRNWFARGPKQGPEGKGGSGGTGWWAWDLGGGMGGAEEGCLWVLAIFAAIIVLFLVAWLLIEIVIPVLTLILYGLVRGMLARVANQRHRCQGRSGAALLWGGFYATLYTAPLALVVWVVHLIVGYRGGA